MLLRSALKHGCSHIFLNKVWRKVKSYGGGRARSRGQWGRVACPQWQQTGGSEGCPPLWDWLERKLMELEVSCHLGRMWCGISNSTHLQTWSEEEAELKMLYHSFWECTLQPVSSLHPPLSERRQGHHATHFWKWATQSLLILPVSISFLPFSSLPPFLSSILSSFRSTHLE